MLGFLPLMEMNPAVTPDVTQMGARESDTCKGVWRERVPPLTCSGTSRAQLPGQAAAEDAEHLSPFSRAQGDC